MSKRGQELQGGRDGERGLSGTETPMDTPIKATAAQMANRKIATMKGRKARATSPTKTGTPAFGGFGQQASVPAPPSNNIFADTNGSGASSGISSGFSFGQQQQQPQPANVGFSFGQNQPSASSSFTFGQSQPAQNGGFTFGGNNSTSSPSFPPAAPTANNIFAANGTSATQPSTSFSGNIFSFGATTNQSQGSNNFGFGSNTPSPAPISPGQPAGLSNTQKEAIVNREKYMTPLEQKRLEEMVASYLPDSPSSYQKDAIDYIPANVLQQVSEYVKTLPSPSFGSSQVAQTLFAKPYRAKTARDWLSDVQRDEIKKTAQGLSQSDQAQLAQIAKDSVESLRFKADNELPSVEQLPNDVQYKMLDFVRSNSQAPAASPPVQEDAEKPRANPFASLKAATPAPSPASSNSFTFGSVSTTKPPSASPAPSFGQPQPASTNTDTMAQTNDSSVPKPNPFASVSRPQSIFPSPQPPSKPISFFNPPPQQSAAAGVSSAPPSWTPPSSNGTTTSSPKPTFSFDSKTSTTPAPATSNIFSFASQSAKSSERASQVSATPTRQQGSMFTPAVPNETAAASPAPGAKPFGTSTAPVKPAISRLQALNTAFRKETGSLPTDTDWTPFVKSYLTALEKLKKEAEDITSNSSPSSSAIRPTSESAATKRTNESISTSDASDVREESPAKRSKSGPVFQLAPPQKPLSATASLFNNILDSPDKPQAAVPTQTSSPSSSATSAFGGFKVQSTSTSNTSAAPSSFQVPKFGGGASTGPPKFGSGTPTNFMSAFGAQAAKQAEKDKKKRKDADFDSDEDDEAEWERQDQEKQEEKRKALAQNASKVMKMVNGKYEWVDAAPAAPPVQVEPPKQTFSFGATSATSSSQPFSNPFSHLAASTANGTPTEEEDDDDHEETDEETEVAQVPATPAKSASLFDRIEQKSIPAPQGANGEAAKIPTFSFGTTSPAGDQTWKPETPIKFFGGDAQNDSNSTTPTGSPAKPLFSFTKTSEPAQPPVSVPPKSSFGATNSTANAAPAAPKFSFGTPSTSTTGSSTTNGTSLFANLGSSTESGSTFKFGGTTNNSSTLSAPPSGTASIFGSPSVSRATTPGATTADDTPGATDNEEDATAPPEEQRDLTSLSAEELRTEDVLFEQKARCRKFVRGADQPWETKGVGIVRLLRNKSTSTPRVLMRLAPSGVVVINGNLLKQKSMYSLAGEKVVKLVFAGEGGELNTYTVSFGTADKAKEMLEKVLESIA